MIKVDWKSWPKEKPKIYGEYLVTRMFPSKNIVTQTAGFSLGRWLTKTDSGEVIAWAEMPEPYQGETNNDK